MSLNNLQRQCLDILQDGRHRFGAMLGIVSRITARGYEIFAVSSATGIPETGEIFPLDAVYCREVVKSRKTVAITEINGVPGMRLHPLYDCIPCEFYISSPIEIGGKVWGTLNFTSFTIRSAPFSPDDIAYNELQAQIIASAIREAGCDMA